MFEAIRNLMANGNDVADYPNGVLPHKRRGDWLCRS